MTKKRNNLLNILLGNDRSVLEESSQNKINQEDNTLLKYYTSIIDNHPGLILIVSSDGKIVSYDKRKLNELLGYRPNRRVSFKELVSKEDMRFLRQTFFDTVKGKSDQIYIKVYNKQDEELDVATTFVPIESANNHVEGVLIILEDITAQRQLERSYELKASHLEQAQELARIGSWEYRIGSDRLICSKMCANIFGFEHSEENSIEIPLSFTHPADDEYVREKFNKAIHSGVDFTVEYRIVHGMTQDVRYIKIKAEVVFKNNQPYKLVGITMDQTEQALLDLELMETNQRYEHVFNNLDAGIWIRESIEGKLLFISKGLKDLLKLPLDSLYGDVEHWTNMIIPEHRERVISLYASLREGKKVEAHYQIKTGDGSVRWVLDQTIPRLNEAGELGHIFGMMIDVTEKIELQEKINFLASYDDLTHLPNKNSLYDRLDGLVNDEKTKEFALFYLDVDSIDSVTDSLGQHIGEALIKEIASLLKALLGEDNYLATIANDVFAIIIKDYEDKEAVFQIAETILSKISEQLIVNEYEIYVTASVGISFYPDHGLDRQALINNCYTALYHAKQLGKNNYHLYSFDLNIASHKRYMLERDLREAIKNEDFEVYYQPQVNIIDGTIEGVEALLRWNHEEWGSVAPEEFIPIAEEKHLVHEIDRWVLRQIIKQLDIWRQEEKKLYSISVNISPIHLLKHGVIDMIKKKLAEKPYLARFIELEITEHSLLQHDQVVKDTLNELKKLGIRLAIDDFGTGYSTFHYLHHFDFDSLKIDRLFIQNLNIDDYSSTKEAAIMSSFIFLAKKLNMKLIVEGIEDHGQLEFLRQNGCTLVQGYLYSEPVPLNKIEQMIRVGHIKPQVAKQVFKPENERRKYFRFTFPRHIVAKMYIQEVNNKKVNIGSAQVLVENISIGGLRFISTLRLPTVTTMKLHFELELVDGTYKIDSTLVYQNEEMSDLFSYGVKFTMPDNEKDRLANAINHMTVMTRVGKLIPNLTMIKTSPYVYFKDAMM